MNGMLSHFLTFIIITGILFLSADVTIAAIDLKHHHHKSMAWLRLHLISFDDIILWPFFGFLSFFFVEILIFFWLQTNETNYMDGIKFWGILNEFIIATHFSLTAVMTSKPIEMKRAAFSHFIQVCGCPTFTSIDSSSDCTSGTPG